MNRSANWLVLGVLMTSVIVSAQSGLNVAHDKTLRGNGDKAKPLGVNLPLELSGFMDIRACLPSSGVACPLAVVKVSNSGDGRGIEATSNGIGIAGYSTKPGKDPAGTGVGLGGAGVYGQNDAPGGVGVRGKSSVGFAVYGESKSGTGVLGASTTGAGVSGSSDSEVGVVGTSRSNYGVSGISATGYGVAGLGGNIGVYAHNTDGTPGRDVYLATRSAAGDFYGNVFIHENLSVSGTINPSSDRSVKARFQDIDVRGILGRVIAMPVQTWNYKREAPNVRHMGVMAQDFRAAFGLGADDKHIATVDADGVALAAIQGLALELKDRDTRIGALEVRYASLEARLLALERHR